MKKYLVILLVVMFCVSISLMGIGCKEEVVEEAPEVTEEAAEEVPAEKGEEEPVEDVTEEEVTTVTMSSYLAAEEGSVGALEYVIELFEKENPDVNVELIAIPYEQTYQQVLISIAAGNAPDVMNLAPQWIVVLAAMGGLEDLSPYYTDEDLADMPERFRENLTINEALVGSPWSIGPVAVFAWKDLLEEAGLPLEIPKTWPEFTDAIAKISALRDDVFGVTLRTDKGANSAFWFFPVLWGHGGQFEDEEGQIVFGDEGTVKALEWYKELGEKNYTPIGTDSREIRNLFVQGKMGFMFDQVAVTGIFPTLSENPDIGEEYIAGEFPNGPNGETNTIANSFALAIAEQSEVKDAAMRLVKFLTENEECTKHLFKNRGMLPSRLSLLEDPMYQSDPNNKTFIEMSKYADNVISKNENFQASLEFISNAMQEALLGGNTAEIAERAQKNIKILYNQ